MVVLLKRQDLFPFDPLPFEDTTLGNGVVHHFLLPKAVAHEGLHLFCLLAGPFLFPDRISVCIDGLDFREGHALGLRDLLQYRILANEVSHHDKAATSNVKRPEEC